MLNNKMLCLLGIGAGIFVTWQWQNIKYLYKGLTLFNKSTIVDNFRSMTNLGFPYNTAKHGDIAEFIEGYNQPLPKTFTFNDITYNLEEWLKDHWTTGLVVLKVESPTNARLLHESYYLGNSRETKTISWSVGKSVVSALIGIAISEQKIQSIDDDVCKYAPKLKESGYNGVKIKDVLQMSSGISFDENYANSMSDINKMAYWLTLGWDLEDFISSLKRDKEPGTIHNYISVDTQVLGMVLSGAINKVETPILPRKSLTSYLEDKIWRKGGFESDCHWLLDNNRSLMELAFGTLNACTRDYARFGWLYLNNGLSPLDGNRLIDEKWIKESVSLTETHLEPNYPYKIGYGYQWWLPGSESEPNKNNGDYLAIGVYNQFIYVNPSSGIVIARNSANPNYNSEVIKVGEHEINTGELEAINAFRAIAHHYDELQQ